MSNAKKISRGWFDKPTLAAMFAVTPTQYDRGIRPSAPADAVRDIDGKLYFYARKVIDAWAAAQAEKSAGADPLLAGGDSPQLERIRAAEADLREMKRDEMRGTHADIRELDSALNIFASRIRRGGETLQRRMGNEASDILNEAIAEALRSWERERDTRNKQRDGK